MKMWAGRFKKDEDARVNDFNSSISFDARMFAQDITGSIAHAAMLKKQGIIESAEADAIVQGLSDIRGDLESGALNIDPEAEDIHMFVEAELTRRLGSTGKRLHTARSRNDQVALDIRMVLMQEVGAIDTQLKSLLVTLSEKAQMHLNTVMPGYTHMQRAQPVTFAHHLMAYAQMFCRDLDRLRDAKRRMDVMPLGSGALAGTTYNIDRRAVMQQLGFSSITANSLDGVSDRDFCIELCSAIALCMMHLSRLCEEIVLWCSWEFKFIELDDAFATGSSIMPQKKNPDVAELVRGKSGRVFGDLMALLTMMKGLPLSYNKDMQEDKQAIFDAVDTLKMCLTSTIPMIDTMKVNADNMRAAAANGFINATDCADYLVKKGLAFRDAYTITGKLIALCIDEGLTLETLTIEQYKAACETFDEDVYESISLEACLKGRNVEGGPAPLAVKAQIEQLKLWLKE